MLQKLVWRRKLMRICKFAEIILKNCADASHLLGGFFSKYFNFRGKFANFCHSFRKQYYRRIRMDFWKSFAALWPWDRRHMVEQCAKNQYWKFETNIPRKGIAWPQSKYPHSRVCERFIYIPTIDICLFWYRKYVDRCWEYINRSQTHECGNWDWGRAVPRKGIHKWDFRCSAGLYTVFIVRYASKKYHAVYLRLYKCFSRPLQ